MSAKTASALVLIFSPPIRGSARQLPRNTAITVRMTMTAAPVGVTMGSTASIGANNKCMTLPFSLNGKSLVLPPLSNAGMISTNPQNKQDKS